MVGYAPTYMVPMFSLVLDRDLNEDLVLPHPEFYKGLSRLTKVRAHLHPIFLRFVCAHW